MKTPAFDMTRFAVAKTRGSERGELLDRFLERLNPSRTASGFPPLSIKRMAFMLSHIPTDELHAFYRQCETYNGPFSKAFFGALKVRKETQTRQAP